MYYFRDSDKGRYRFPFNSEYGKRTQAILARTLTPNTEITFVNIHSDHFNERYFTHEDPNKQQLTIVNWGHPSDYYDNDEYYRTRLRDLGLCDSSLYLPIVVDAEVHFTEPKYGMILASFDKVKNRLYLLYNAWYNQSTSELDMFSDIIRFYASALPDHPLFQHQVIPEEEPAYNKVITFDPKFTNPQLNQFKQQYQQQTENVENYRCELTKALALTQSLSKQIAALSAVKELPPVTVNNKWVRHTESTPEGFIIYTNPLFIYNIDKRVFESHVKHEPAYSKYSRLLPEILKGLGRKYGWYAGQYKITIDLMNSWKIHFKNLDNPRSGYWDSGGKDNHPHVAGNGSGCLGDLTELVMQAQANFDIVVLADVIIQYLQSTNLSDSAGFYLHKWDLIDMTTMKDAITSRPLVITPTLINVEPRNIVLGDMPSSTTR